MKAAVITFPGSNCDDDLVFVLKTICEFEVDRLWHKDTPDLSPYDLVCIPGGFSYGDYLRCGAMASLSPIMDAVKAFAESGKFVIGICNGFQILCESRLLPGALVRNEGQSFLCKDVELNVETPDTPWSCELTKGERVVFPIAHGEGRYVVGEEEYKTMLEKGQIVLTYTSNPNGSLHNIAGICNARKNVFALMPHPERATDVRSRDGMKLWKSIVTSIRRGGT